MTTRRRFLISTALVNSLASARAQSPAASAAPAHIKPPERLDELLSVYDFEAAARNRVFREAYEYVASGAGDELTLKWNRESLDKIRPWPRALVERSQIDTRVELLGHELRGTA